MKKDTNNAFKWIVSSQYFLYFGVMGVFLPYFNLYCYHLKFTGFEIGVLSAIRSVALILTPLIWGSMADRFRTRRPIYILCSFISTGIWAFYLFTADFWAMLVITIFYGIFYSPIISFLEAFAMDVLDTEKKSYGKLRAWGSIAFIITVIVLGKIIDLYSIEIILSLIFFGSLAQALISVKIPDIQIKKQPAFFSKAKALLQRRVVIFLFCAFLMLMSHGTYYGFYSIHLENLGYDKTFIGIAWALASAAEIIVMIKSDSIFQRFSLDHVLFFSFMVAAFRWIALSFATSPVSILFLQVFHAVTYAMFHVSSILYIDASTPVEAKTLGQAVNNAITYGLGLMVGFFLNGYLFETLGSFTLFRMSGFIAIGGGILLKCSQLIDGRAGQVQDAKNIS
jgi:PPP family 3-phenylpropionic acid transporter